MQALQEEEAIAAMAQPLVYHEKQVAALCGVHALNTLLQGPFFSEIELAQVRRRRRRWLAGWAGWLPRAAPAAHTRLLRNQPAGIQYMGRALRLGPLGGCGDAHTHATHPTPPRSPPVTTACACGPLVLLGGGGQIGLELDAMELEFMRESGMGT